MYICLCIAHKQSRWGFLVGCHCVDLCSRVSREGPPHRTRVKSNVAYANVFSAVGVDKSLGSEYSVGGHSTWDRYGTAMRHRAVERFLLVI